MKQFCAVLLVALIVTVTYRDALVFLSFKLNQAYIAKYQCINRNKPITQCNGNCQLEKKLSETRENSDNPIPYQIQNDTKIDWITPHLESQKLITTSVFKIPVHPHKSQLKGYLDKLIKPPKVA